MLHRYILAKITQFLKLKHLTNGMHIGHLPLTADNTSTTKRLNTFHIRTSSSKIFCQKKL